MNKYVTINGQVWMAEYVPDVGWRYVRLTRAPRGDQNVKTLSALKTMGTVTPLVEAQESVLGS